MLLLLSYNFERNMEEKKDFQGSEKGTSLNNSGQGSSCIVPDIVAKNFNWGAAIFNIIWGISNKTYIPFLPCCIVVFIFNLLLHVKYMPFWVDIILRISFYIFLLCYFIYSGINGNKWAWQNKKWKSIQDFHKIQKRWAVDALIYCILIFILPVVILMYFFWNDIFG